MEADPAGLTRLVVDALAGGPARAQLFEVAAAGRTSNDGSLDVLLDDLARRAAAGDESATELVLELVHRLRLWRSAVVPIVSDPTNPLADANGMVRYPDIDLGEQMTQLMMAQRAYQANIAVVERAKDAYAQALELGK